MIIMMFLLWLVVRLLMIDRVVNEVDVKQFTKLVKSVDEFEDKYIQKNKLQQEFNNITMLNRFKSQIMRNNQLKLQNNPISEQLLIQIQNYMILPRKKEYKNLIAKINKFLMIGYDLYYIQNILKSICYEQKWSFKFIEAGDILVIDIMDVR